MFHSWLSHNYIEVIGSIAGLVYIYFSIKQLIWLWPLGILTSLLYFFIFFEAKFYADMALQLYYIYISIYGWNYWSKNKTNNEEKVPVITSSLKEWIVFVLLTIIFSVIIGIGLDNFTDSPLPYWDAFTTAGSIIATWMLARKYLEQWLFWIIIDFVSMGAYIYKNLYPTSILFGIYTVMAGIGYLNWRKDLKKNIK